MTNEKVDLDCPVCGIRPFGWRFDKKGKQFWRCMECGLEKQHPLPSEAELKSYYEQSYAEGMYQAFAAASQMKELTARERLRELSGKVPFAGRWLDVGCANGVFVGAAIAAGIKAEGVELSEIAVAEGRDKGLPITAGTITDLDAGELFDCITAFDVLEHVIDPRGFVKQLASRLKPGGHLVLTVPNRRSLPAKLMGSRWYFYIPEEHLHYFDPTTLPRLMEHNGLTTSSVKRTSKPLTFNYSLTQFAEYNPLIHRLLNLASYLLPSRLKEHSFPLSIGEMMLIARNQQVAVNRQEVATQQDVASPADVSASF